MSVDDQHHVVKVGEIFAKLLKLLRLEAGPCATLEFDDEDILMCEGDERLF